MWLDQKAGGLSLRAQTSLGQEDYQFNREKVKPPILSPEKKNVVDLEENIQVFEPNTKLSVGEDLSNECLNNEQGQNTALDEKPCQLIGLLETKPIWSNLIQLNCSS